MKKPLLTLQILADIFENHDNPEKITVEAFPETRDILIKIEDLDDEWFQELKDTGITQILHGNLNLPPIQGK